MRINFSIAYVFAKISVGALILSLLSACGGGNLGQALGTIAACTLANCKNSDTMPISDITTQYIITQQNGIVNVSASLGQTMNLFTVVSLSGSDSLTASIGNQTVSLQQTDPNSFAYVGALNNNSTQPTITASFNRGTTAYPSTVTMPPALLLLSPATINVNKFAGTFQVQLNSPINANISAPMTANCNRADGSTFSNNTSSLAFVSFVANSNGTTYTMGTQNLDANLNKLSQAPNSNNVSNLSPVVSCTLNVNWTNSVKGIANPALYSQSSIVANQLAAQVINYSAGS